MIEMGIKTYECAGCGRKFSKDFDKNPNAIDPLYHFQRHKCKSRKAKT